MLFVMAVTVCALALLVFEGARGLAAGRPLWDPPVMNACVSLLLLALAAIFVVEALRHVRRGAPASAG
jgi:hypothetical protein